MLVVDTSVLLAAAHNADPDHDSCTRAIESAGPLVTTALVIAETAFSSVDNSAPRQRQHSFALWLRVRSQVELMTPAEARPIADLIETYSDLGLSETDASLIVLTERLNAMMIAMLDHRHFGVVRPNHVAVVPDISQALQPWLEERRPASSSTSLDRRILGSVTPPARCGD